MNSSKRISWLVLFAGLSVGAGALALEPEKTPPLGGPPVTERKVPGVVDRFGEGMDEQRARMGQSEIPHRVFVKAVGDALGPSAPAEVRMTAEQEEQLRALDREFSEKMRAFTVENRREMEELREVMDVRRPGAGKGGDKAMGKSPDDARPGEPAEEMSAAETARREALMERARLLREKMPRAGDVHKKAWEILNEGQRAAVEKELEKFRQQQRQQREDNYVKSRVKKKEPVTAPGEVQGQPQAPGKKPQGGGVTPERRERLLKLLERLSPEQQEELLRRLEERLSQGEGRARARPEASKPEADPKKPQ